MAKLNLLRLIKIVCEGCAQCNEHITRSSLQVTVEKLSTQDDAVLVRQVSRLDNSMMRSILDQRAFNSARERDHAIAPRIATGIEGHSL